MTRLATLAIMRAPCNSKSVARLATLAIVLAACSSKSSTPKPPPVGRLLAVVLAAADNATVPWRCASADVPGLPDEELVTGERTWKTSGHTLTRVGTDAEVVIGVVADAGGASPRTVAALGRLRAALDATKPDLVLTLGGMGSTTEDLEATLGTLGDRASWPVVALPGDLEAMSGHVATIARLRKRGDVIFDGRLVRYIELPGASIGTLPGAGAVERLAASGDGCRWTAEDVAAIYTQLTGKPGIRIVASAEAPRTTVDGEAAGELTLVPSKALPVEVVLHGPAQPAPSGARAGSRDGAGVLLSPGTADATSRLPRAAQPAAGVLIIRGTTWAWRPLVDAT